MNKKQFYTSPEVDVLVVRFEENIMSVTGSGNPNSWTSGNSGWWDDDD